METTKINWEHVETNLRATLEEFETKTLKGEHGDGNWHYLRAWLGSDGDVTFAAGVEPSRCLPESEYYARPGHPITIRQEQQCFSPGARDGLEWVDCDAGEEPEYFRDATGDRYVVAEDFDAAKHLGWVGFRLGEPVDPIDVDDAVKAAMEEMADAWGDLVDVGE